MWDAFFVIDSRFVHLSPPQRSSWPVLGVFALALLLWPGGAAGQGADSSAVGWRGGFVEPVAVIAEIGLWADAMSELGYGARPGLLVWWGLEPETVAAGSPLGGVDWRKYTFRIRVEVFSQDGRRVAKAEELIDPLEKTDIAPRGGFPTAEHLVIDTPGKYRARLEAYPLMEAAEAGLDSVPRGVVETDVIVAERALGNSADWLISDLLFLDSIEDWVPGSHSERTWYEWVIYPNVARVFSPDSSGALVAFEIERGDEIVPRCVRSHCRVVITVIDDNGGIVEQAMRQVPEATSVSAYVVPIRTVGLEPGRYHTRVEIFEAGDRIFSVSRPFEIREGAMVGNDDPPAPAEGSGDRDGKEPGDTGQATPQSG